MKTTPKLHDVVVVTNDPDQLLWIVKEVASLRVAIIPVKHHPKEAPQWVDRCILSLVPA